MTTIKTILTPRGKKIRSITDQVGNTYFCFTDVCKALYIDPVKAITHLRCSFIVSLPVKVHNRHNSTRFLMPDGFAKLSDIFRKPEAVALRDYLLNAVGTTEDPGMSDIVKQCKPIVKLMVGLRKYRDNVADAFHEINGDVDMELHEDYTQVQEHIARAIDSLGRIIGYTVSQSINY